MHRVAIYCRLSDEDQNKLNKLEDSESIQNQKELLSRYAMEKGWTIYKTYSDDDYSGLDKDRPAFNQMLGDAREGKFDIILCKHQSRFSRDIETIERYLHNKFQQWKIRFISITDHVDTAEKGNKKSRQINSLVNEWYCEDISEAIRATFKIKREQGKFIGSFAPYGYKKDTQDKSKLIIDREAAEVVKMIFNLYTQGNGTQHIAHLLNEQGIPNPTRYKQFKGLKFQNSSLCDGYGFWNKTTIRRMLRNEVYIGNMVQGKREKVDYKSMKMIEKSKDKWDIVLGTHQPIIEERIFKEVQKRLDCKIRSSGEGKAHVFAGKIRCMDCGSSMNKTKSGRGVSYLTCKTYAMDTRKVLCTSHSIRLDELTEVIRKKLEEYIRLLDAKGLACRLNNEGQQIKKSRMLVMELEKIKRAIEEKDHIIRSLYIDKVKNILSSEQFYDLNTNFTRERAILQERKIQIEEELNKRNLSNNIDEKWIEIVKKYMKFEELTPIQVSKLVDFIEIGEKDKETRTQKVTIHWKF